MTKTSLYFLLVQVAVAVQTVSAENSAETACTLLQTALPSSVFFPGSSNYDADIRHATWSSTQNATCSVEPKSAEDISTILGIVGREDIRSPFAVKSGGHNSNVGFSSTTGVEIAMSNFDSLVYDPSTQTAKVDTGLLWSQVYERLLEFNVTVPGGRNPSVGVGGISLGGGFSWVTDEHGLTIDNIISYDVVLPNGTFATVTDESNPDLSFALKGSLNNFGIVTSFTLKAYPIGEIWGGTVVYGAESSALVASAVSNYSLYNTDPKAQIIPLYSNTNGTSQWTVVLFYNDAAPPSSVFKSFLNIPSVARTMASRSFFDFVSSQSVAADRASSHTVPIIRYTPKIIEAVQSNADATYAKAVADGRSITRAVVILEPFQNAFAHSVPSAYPHDASRPLTPSNPALSYTSPEDDEYFKDALKNMSNAIQEIAVQEGQSSWTDIYYNNYALGDTPVELIYGDNLSRLKDIKRQVDPENVMGLAGGFKL